MLSMNGKPADKEEELLRITMALFNVLIQRGLYWKEWAEETAKS